MEESTKHLILILVLFQVATFVASQTTTAAPIDNRQYSSCQDNGTYCNSHGTCYQSTDLAVKICSCSEDYYGTTCQNKVDTLYKKLVYALGIICAILLIILVFVSWSLNSKSNAFDDYKDKVAYEKKQEKKKQHHNGHLKPRSRQGSVSSTSSAVSASKGGQKNDGFLYQITATGIERSESYDARLNSDPVVQRENEVAVNMDMLDSAGKMGGRKNELDNRSVSSASATGSSNFLILQDNKTPGRPRSWGGPSSEFQREDMNKIYSDYYRPHSDDEGGGESTDRRGYVQKPRSHTGSNLSVATGYSDSRGRPRSMADLRMLALQGETNRKAKNNELSVGGKPQKTYSVENIHTGQITVLSANPSRSPQARRKKPMGIHARELERKSECPF